MQSFHETLLICLEGWPTPIRYLYLKMKTGEGQWKCRFDRSGRKMWVNPLYACLLPGNRRVVSQPDRTKTLDGVILRIRIRPFPQDGPHIPSHHRIQHDGCRCRQHSQHRIEHVIFLESRLDAPRDKIVLFHRLPMADSSRHDALVEVRVFDKLSRAIAVGHAQGKRRRGSTGGGSF